MIMVGPVLEYEAKRILNEGIRQGIEQGRKQGIEQGIALGEALVAELLKEQRFEDLKCVAEEISYREKLLKELNIMRK